MLLKPLCSSSLNEERASVTYVRTLEGREVDFLARNLEALSS
jgi:hypothetical protein